MCCRGGLKFLSVYQSLLMSFRHDNVTLRSTYPGKRSCANAGNQLIEVAFKRLMKGQKENVDFSTFFYEDPLDDFLDKIKNTVS